MPTRDVPSQQQPASSDLAAFPCRLTITVPFPTPRLAQIALQSLSVDKELSPLVQRSFSLTTASTTRSSEMQGGISEGAGDAKVVLATTYAATTNRMLRVSVNGFFESLGVVLDAMRELDGDVAGLEWRGGDGDGDAGDGAGEEGEGRRLEEAVRGLERVQGLEERGALGNV